MKIALVGCGQIGDAHLVEIQKIPECEVVAICDRYRSILEATAYKFKVPRIYQDYAAMLTDSSPDVVHITTPPPSHFDLAKEAMEAGCHVFIENPFTVTLKEREDLINIAEKNNVLMCVGTNYMFRKAQTQAFQKIQAGEIGELVHIDTVYTYNIHGIFGKMFLSNPNHWVPKMPGQLFQNIIFHPLGQIVPFLSDNFEVKARAYDLSGCKVVHDELRLMIYDQKLTASINLSCNSRPIMFNIAYYGSEKSLFIDGTNDILLVEEPPNLPSAFAVMQSIWKRRKSMKKQFWGIVKDYFSGNEQYFSSMNRLFQAFYSSVQHKTPLPISYDELRKTGLIIDEMVTQIRPENANLPSEKTTL